MKNNKYRLKSNQYSPELEGGAIVCGAGDYSPYIVPATKELKEEGGRVVKTLGVNEVGDCIGIIGWHEKTKTAYVYHMNGADHFRLVGSSLILLESITNDASIKSNVTSWIESIRKAEFIDGGEVAKSLCQTHTKFLHSNNNPLREMRYTLVTSDDEKVNSLLRVFESLGINKDQISIDIHQSQLFIDRESGRISNSHKDYPQELSEASEPTGPSRISPSTSPNTSASTPNGQSLFQKFTKCFRPGK